MSCKFMQIEIETEQKFNYTYIFDDTIRKNNK